MLKLTVAIMAIGLLGSAGADAWPSLRIDAGSQRAFKRSLELAKEQLSPADQRMLGGALKQIWHEGTRSAQAEHREYSAQDYLRQIDGLTYEEVVHFTAETYAAAEAARDRAPLNEVAAVVSSSTASTCPCADVLAQRGRSSASPTGAGSRHSRATSHRSLRVDASSEMEFKESVALFQDKLSASRRHAFQRALEDIWIRGIADSAAAQREYTSADYFAQLDGLGYDQVVTLLDPTGDTAKRYRAEYEAYNSRGRWRGGSGCAGSSCSGLPLWYIQPPTYSNTLPRGYTDLFGSGAK